WNASSRFSDATVRRIEGISTAVTKATPPIHIRTARTWSARARMKSSKIDAFHGLHLRRRPCSHERARCAIGEPFAPMEHGAASVVNGHGTWTGRGAYPLPSQSLAAGPFLHRSIGMEAHIMAYGYLTPRRRGSLATSGPGGGLFDLHREMNRLFDDLFDQDGDSGAYARTGMSTPAMEIHQAEDKIEITAELPGVREEDIDLTVEDGVLTLRGEKKSHREDQQRGYSERSYGTFERRLTLPSNIDEEACSADFKDGVLTITLP